MTTPCFLKHSGPLLTSVQHATKNRMGFMCGMKTWSLLFSKSIIALTTSPPNTPSTSIQKQVQLQLTKPYQPHPVFLLKDWSHLLKVFQNTWSKLMNMELEASKRSLTSHSWDWASLVWTWVCVCCCTHSLASFSCSCSSSFAFAPKGGKLKTTDRTYSRQIPHSETLERDLSVI